MNKQPTKKERDSVLAEIYNHDELSENKSKPKKSRENLIVIATILLGVFTLFFGFVQLKSRIRSPFKQPVNQNFNLNLLSQNENDLTELLAKDTDSDGLSDYDELYVYNSSPYLEDSDSDGILDLAEIKNGTDPNCPVGQTCQSTAVDENPSGEIGSPVVNLRDLLLQSGMTSEMLNKFSDAELQAMYQSVVGSVPKTDMTNMTDNVEMLAGLKDLSPTELRAWLVKQGIDSALLEKLSDEELSQMVEESLK